MTRRLLFSLVFCHLFLTCLFCQEAPMISRGFTTSRTAALERKTFTDAALWGANNLRAFLKMPTHVAPEHYWQALESTLDDAEIIVANAQGTGVRVVLTLGSALPGLDRDQHEYWAYSELEHFHVETWRRIAQRVFPLREHVLGFDLLNEPLDRSVAPQAPTAWRDLAIKITQAIRAIDPDTWIIFEPGPGGTFAGFFDLEPLPDPKVIYSGHFYFPHMFTHQGIHNVKGTELTEAMTRVNVPYPLPVTELKGDLWELNFHRLPDLVRFDKAAIAQITAPLVAFQKKYQVPVYLGEFSVVRWAPKADALRYLADLTEFAEAHQWSWSYHSFREFNGWSLEHGDTLDWLDGMPQPPPSPVLTDRARLILKALAQNRSPLQDIPAIEAALGKDVVEK